MATKLERIQLNEISGVDSPANLVDGWLLMKSADTPTRVMRKVGDPIRLSDGRIVGRVAGFTGGPSRVDVQWASEEIAALAKQARLEDHGDSIYLVGSPSLGAVVLSGQPVILA